MLKFTRISPFNKFMKHFFTLRTEEDKEYMKIAVSKLAREGEITIDLTEYGVGKPFIPPTPHHNNDEYTWID